MSYKSTPFLTPILRGERFEEHGIPLEVWQEFITYERFVTAVARSLYFARNPDRKRVPRGFEDRFRLVVSRIEAGSAIPVIERQHPASDSTAQLALPVRDDFDRARDLIQETIAATTREEDPPEDFPGEHLRFFKTFGKYMRRDESMELRLPGEDEGVRYDVNVRKRLRMLRQADAHNYQGMIELTGAVCHVDTKQARFSVRTSDDAIHTLDLPPQYEHDILRAHATYRAIHVQLSGSATFDAIDDRLLSIDDIEELLLVDRPPDMEERLDELACLERGWFRPPRAPGTPIPASRIRRAREVLRAALYDHNTTPPRIYPTPEGGLQFEWTLNGWGIELEWTEDDHVELFATPLDGEGEERSAEHDASDPGAAKKIADFVNQFEQMNS